MMSRVSIKGILAGCAASVFLLLTLGTLAAVVFVQSHGLRDVSPQIWSYDLKQNTTMGIILYLMMGISVVFGGYISAFFAQRNEVLNSVLFAVSLLLLCDIGMVFYKGYRQPPLTITASAILCASLGGYMGLRMKEGQK
jgi:hypothetical protein